MNQKLTKGGHTSHLPLHTSNRGITLIALVITIIVLLILAGVTINMVLGDDGIIQNAQKAKERYEDEAEEEQDALDIAAGNLDLHTKGTVANTVKVGDYVEYIYNPGTVEITAEESGLKELSEDGDWDDESLAIDQNFNSATGGNAQVTAWRVLSKKDGIVKLVAETPINSELTLAARPGWVNGPDILNDMCKTLYSSDIGTGRSINVEDINEITKYDGTKYYTNYDGDKVPIAPDETMTIAEAAKTAGENGAKYDMDNFLSKVPEEGKNIAEYEITNYSYDVDDGSYKNKWLTAGDKEYQMLFGDDNMTYWLASSSVICEFDWEFASFHLRFIKSGKVTGGTTFNGNLNLFPHMCTVRPVVTLKTGLKIDTTDATRDGSSTAPYKIKMKLD